MLQCTNNSSISTPAKSDKLTEDVDVDEFLRWISLSKTKRKKQAMNYKTQKLINF